MDYTQCTVLVADDDRDIVRAIATLLEQEGLTVLRAYNGLEALEAVAEHPVSLILIDVMMPKLDGLSAMMKIREQKNIPILILSAKSEESDKILGLSMGADDYIAKPFSIREVLARVRSVLRRTAQPAAEEKAVAFEGLRMDLTRKVCTIDGEPLALTKKEFEILALLLSSRGKIFSREEILRQVWSDEVIVLDRTIDVNITRLRRKIGPYGEHIVTRLGYGYGFEE